MSTVWRILHVRIVFQLTKRDDQILSLENKPEDRTHLKIKMLKDLTHIKRKAKMNIFQKMFTLINPEPTGLQRRCPPVHVQQRYDYVQFHKLKNRNQFHIMILFYTAH